jgi:hypothetical protein
MRRPADPSRLYASYAAAFLVLTLLSGVWLRGAFVRPEVLGGLTFGHLLHGHSHVAFFGWTTMALFAVIARAADLGSARPGLRRHAHLTAAASAAAFVGFSLGGYNRYTIAISVVHVALWAGFVALAWRPLERVAPLERRFFRGAAALLALAGAGAMAPGVVMARGIADPWTGQLALQSFLTPFVTGWLLLGSMGAVYAGLRGGRRRAGPAYWCVAVGVLPSALLHPSAAPPLDWLLGVGRAGTLLVGAGTLLFAADVLRDRAAAPLVQLAGAAAGLKGTAELLVGLGVGLDLLASRPLTIAYLHLALLGLATPALMAAALGVAAAPRRAALYAGGLAVMLASLVATGWHPAAAGLLRLGVSVPHLFGAALFGGAVCAVAGIALLRGPPPTARAAQRGVSVAVPVAARASTAVGGPTATSTAIAANSSAR